MSVDNGPTVFGAGHCPTCGDDNPGATADGNPQCRSCGAVWRPQI